MADTKLSGLTAITGANVDMTADLLYIDDVSVTTSKKILVQELYNATALAEYLTSVAGTNTITATAAPVPGAYAAGQMFTFLPANTNTGATTLNISSLGAKNIYNSGVALVGSELTANIPCAVVYDGTQFQILASPSNYQTWTPVLTFGTPGNLAVTYGTQLGFAIRQGRQITLWWVIITTGFTFTTSSGNLEITGNPYTTGTSIGNGNFVGSSSFTGITKTGYTLFSPALGGSNSVIAFNASGSGQTSTTVMAADVPSGGTIQLQGSLTFFI